MPRMTSQYCLWTILFLFQLTLLNTNAAEVRTHRLPIEIDQLLVIPEPDQSQSELTQFGDAFHTQCDFFSRASVANRTTNDSQNGVNRSPRREVVKNDLPPRPAVVDSEHSLAESESTCPTEFRDDADCQPLTAQHRNVTDRSFGQFWIEVWQFVAPHQDYITQSQSWLEMEIEVYECEMYGSVLSTADLIAARISKAIELPASNPSPMTRVSHAKTISEDVISEDATTESDVEDQNNLSIELKVAEAIAKPIKLDDSVDPYWQYYEDCDRWGVNFAMLLSDPSIANGDFDVELPNPEQCDVTATKKADQPAIETVTDQTRLQFWFDSIPTIGRDAWQGIQIWAENHEFHAVETEGVDLDSIQKSGSQASEKVWWEGLQIEISDRMEILQGNFREIADSIGQFSRGSREAIASRSTDTRK